MQHLDKGMSRVLHSSTAQSGFEYSILIGMFLLLVISIGLYVNFELSKGVDATELDSASRQIVYAAETLAGYGPESFRVVQIKMPKDIHQVQTLHNTIALRRTKNNMDYDTHFPTGSRIYGFLDTTRDAQYYLLKSEPNGFISISPLRYPNLTNGLIGMYSMDIQNGTHVFSSVNSSAICEKFNSAITGTIVSETGYLGKAMSFDQVDDALNCSNLYDFEKESFSMGAWIKSNSPLTWEKSIISNGHFGWSNGTLLTISYVDNVIIGGIGANGEITDSVYVKGSTYVSDNQWHHAMMVFDSNKQLFKVYVDGFAETLSLYTSGLYTTCGTIVQSNKALDTSVCPTINASSRDNFEYFTIGSWLYQNSNARLFNGSIDEVVIYNRALSDAEVYAIYDSGR